MLQNQGGFNPRYIFNIDSVEVGRIGPSWSSTNWGFYRIGLQPSGLPFPFDASRRLEIYDDASAPQVRITSKLIGGTSYTDLETTTIGDFLIQPSTSNVGINLSNSATLTRTLDVNGNGRFRSLPSAVDNTLTKLVVVNSNGEFYTRDVSTLPGGGGGGSLNVCSGGIANNYLLRMDVSGTNTLCKSQIFDDYTNLKVGVDDITPSYKLDVAGDLGINDPLYYKGYRTITNEGPAVVGSLGSNLYLGPNSGNISTPNINYANTAVGVLAMSNLSSTSGYNTGVGFISLRDVTSGWGNTAIGSSAGSRTTTGLNNIYIGNLAGVDNQTGEDNVIIGNNAASDQLSGSGDLGNFNVLVGSYSGGKLTSSAYGNASLGTFSGSNLMYGDDNIFIGSNANIDQYQNANAFENCIMIGEDALGQLVGSSTYLHDGTAIGHNATVNCNDCIVLGEDASARTLMGYNDVPSLSNSYRLYVNPISSGRAAYFNGDVYCTGAYLPSDPNLKTNIRPMPAVDAILNELHPKTYFFDSTGQNARLNLPRGLQYGLLSTEVELVLPDLIHEQTEPARYDSLGNVVDASFSFKSVNYVALIPILLQKIKDHEAEIDSLRSNTNDRLNQLEAAINACCTSGAARSSRSEVDVTLSSENTIILNQNDPNPFAEQTRITFTIPQDVAEAKIIFFNNSGKVLQTVNINERGEGQMNVYGEKLSSGIYSYSLIADGKVIDTKKMVCVK